ncbi:hypothetical protein GCM10007100_24820 [Roseibacillus persicicus]|uniref:DUF3352 domain-containing protein n=2 Tax=Roseibacillus persicicus TaxID=454148 RepID=A0A918TUE8_9BACT|nr:hypothetical protein GCM10007100_24820 [Roseibacillus persicicus]
MSLGVGLLCLNAMKKLAFSLWGGLFLTLCSGAQGDDNTFAKYLPGDSAVYFEAFNEQGVLPDSLVGLVLNQATITLDEAGNAENEEIPEEMENFSELISSLGNHIAIGIGNEANGFVRESGKVFQEFSGVLAGAQLDMLLSFVDTLQESGEFSPEAIEDLDDPGEFFQGINKFELSGLLDTLAEEGQLAMPSAYLAVKPSAEGMAEGWTSLNELLELALEEEGMERVVTAGKWPAKGFALAGDETMASELEEWWQNASEDERGPLDEKRFEKLKTALANFKLTVMWAKVDGWLVFYLGNGKEGFRLVEDVADSVAADGKLAELTENGSKGSGWMRWRVSEDFLNGLPVWLNDSPSVRAQAIAMSKHVELKKQKEMTDALYEMAKTRSLLSRREVTGDWYGVGWLEDGVRIETVGGMRMPGVDYETEWTLGGGAAAAGTFFKAHWVADKSRVRWNWEQGEAIVELVAAGLAEWMPEELPLSRDFVTEGVSSWAKEMMSLGKEMQLEGLGGERVVAIDLLGEMPQVPDAPSAVLRDGRIPRVLMAYTVEDRPKVEESGKAMWASTENLFKKLEAELGEGIPLPGVMTSEDEGLNSSFILLPFSNDDFVLNAGLNDEVFIQGTSRTQARLFELGRKRKGEKMTGYLFEMDLKRGGNYLKLWNQLSDSALLPFGQAEMLLDDAGLGGEEKLEDQMAKVGKLRYHHREEGGELRSSFVLEIAK